MMEVTIQELKNLLKTVAPGKNSENLEVDVSLLDQGYDSLDFLDLFFNIEEKYNIRISDEDTTKLITLNDFVSYISDRLGQASS